MPAFSPLPSSHGSRGHLSLTIRCRPESSRLRQQNRFVSKKNITWTVSLYSGQQILAEIPSTPAPSNPCFALLVNRAISQADFISLAERLYEADRFFTSGYLSAETSPADAAHARTELCEVPAHPPIAAPGAHHRPSGSIGDVPARLFYRRPRHVRPAHLSRLQPKHLSQVSSPRWTSYTS